MCNVNKYIGYYMYHYNTQWLLCVMSISTVVIICTIIMRSGYYMYRQ
jgi:hypothetical protein